MGRAGIHRLTRQAARWSVAVAMASAVSLAAVGAGVGTAAPASAATAPICASAQHPRAAATMSASIAATLAGRPHSVVGLAALDPAFGVGCSLRATAHFYAASVVKVTILSALLLKTGGRLTGAQQNLASAMITQSNNSAATTLFDEVGMTSMQYFLNRAGMHQTILSSAWGLTQITPEDELTQLRVLAAPGTLLSNSARAYVLGLMAKVTASQRWGVSFDAPANVTVHIKNGWLPYPFSSDWRINSLGVFIGTNINYQVAILTAPAADGQSESYGIATVQAVAGIINRNLAGLYAIFR
jgi:Beta-lactamase enzyme family